MNKNKKLRKSSNKMLFGVCGGIAEYFNIDPTIMRLVFVIAALFQGAGVIFYIVAAIVMPSSMLEEEIDVENLKSANLDSEEEKTSSSKRKSRVKNDDEPHSDDEFDSFFKNEKKK